VNERIALFPCSGEINRQVPDARKALELMRERYGAEALQIDETDGVGFEFADWRFNLRMSNTEPVIRLNVEARADSELMESKTAEILDLIETL
jgi:phosphomannomutase/phosphomannomutase/phosphoglucomutase